MGNTKVQPSQASLNEVWSKLNDLQKQLSKLESSIKESNIEHRVFKLEMFKVETNHIFRNLKKFFKEFKG